ncbi:pentatricopeptide repeat-containing protein [Tripterygium wilfordii]|uniref:Pentatricopeptide repeat-containing protein n=1 Tax=Tripterygium wilfordii TaxID=458696 RepID=A0A7J7CHE8_TRIWF|nr:pentatricopeptide repeat-containing protein At4g02750-like [Tripterygium wilfordii]KAF5733456.1 pentatricopeptide repeat-containing protein [Tripterygium wilfordii]
MGAGTAGEENGNFHMSFYSAPMRVMQKVLSLRISRDVCTLSAITPKSSDRRPTSQHTLSWNRAIARLVLNHQMQKAQDLFDEMTEKDIVSWNTMLSGYSKARNPEQVYQCYLDLERAAFRPNEYTMSIVLHGIMETAFNVLVQQIHARAICLSLNVSVFVGSALIRGYANVGNPGVLDRVFDEILGRDVTSWNALISGYMELGCTGEAQRVFDDMPERNVVSWTSLINGYIASKRISKARSMFNKMSERNVVSWTVMISGYNQNAMFVESLKLFQLMVKSGTQPNNFTFSSVLDACGGCSCLLLGQQVHAYILKFGIPDDVILSTSLLDMYAKCGDIDTAFCVSESMPERNLVSWNSIIGCCARHGLGERALKEFKRMIAVGVEPDRVTFVNLLSACGHGGLVTEGQEHFNSMETKYGIQAELEHYACMVDLYGRAGLLEKARKLIKGMPFEPDVIVWGALLGACRLHSSFELGEFAAKEIYKLKQDNPAAYSVLLKINGDKGAWNSVAELRNLMKERHVKKQKAGSWIESKMDPM